MGTAVAAPPNPPTQSYKVGEILKAYNANGLSVTGSNQKIAVLMDAVPDVNDLTKFWSDNNVSRTGTYLTPIHVGNPPAPDTSAIEEVTLDIEWTSGIAAGANIQLYTVETLAHADILLGLDQILADAQTDATLRQLSLSLGAGESFLTPSDRQAYSLKMFFLVALEVNVFVASGDDGSHPQQGILQPEVPASTRYVIGVGGTRLILTGTGAVSQESGWSGSGGGVSSTFSRTQWQNGTGVPTGTMRLVPDVSAAADPAYGAYIILSGVQDSIGGTSWAAPVWAGFCALINEARKTAGYTTLPFLNKYLYSLISTPKFRDITTGSNGTNNQYDAGVGYDMVTGIGVPNMAELVSFFSPDLSGHPFQNFSVHQATVFPQESDGTWTMAFYSNPIIPDLIFIKTANTPSGMAEIHVATSSSQFQQFILQTSTALPCILNATYQVIQYSRIPLASICQQDIAMILPYQGANKIEVHIASAVSNYQQFCIQCPTAFDKDVYGPTLQMVNFSGGIHPDLAYIQSTTPSGKVQLKIATGDSNYQTVVLDVTTAFDCNLLDGTWTMIETVNGPDLAFIRNQDTLLGRVEVTIASRSSNYQQFTVQTATVFREENNGTWLLMRYGSNTTQALIYIKDRNASSGHTEVHVVPE